MSIARKLIWPCLVLITIGIGPAWGDDEVLKALAEHFKDDRDLKQINSLLTSMAYPVLEEKGLLGGSRLKAG